METETLKFQDTPPPVPERGLEWRKNVNLNPDVETGEIYYIAVFTNRGFKFVWEIKKVKIDLHTDDQGNHSLEMFDFNTGELYTEWYWPDVDFFIQLQ